jgi:quercetin dioxygenase-like cupin family protein
MATARMPQPTTEDPVKVDPRHYKVEFENERVRVLRIKCGPGEKSVMHSHPESIAVFLTDARGKFTYLDGRTEDINANAGTVPHMGERAMSVVVISNGTRAAIEVESLAMPVGFQLSTVKLPLTIPHQTQALLTGTFVPTRAGTYHGTLGVSYRTSNVSRPRRMGIALTGKGATQ